MTGFTAIFFLAVLFVGSGVSQTIETLHWMSGCWRSPDSTYEETWSEPRGSTLMGFSRTVRQNRTQAYEFLQVRSDSAGGIEYVANPSGQSQAAFRLRFASADEAVFENPTHDFPQRIMYRLDKDGSLTATIEGRWKGEERKIRFPMRRVRCP